MASALLPLHEAAGADLAEVAGARVPDRFGDPAGEYRAVREAAGIADRSDLARIRLTGRDPVRMVQGLITNDLAGAGPGRGVYGAMLTPKGRMIAELRAFALPRPEGTEVLLDLPREALAGTVEHLRKFVPPMFARWKDVSEETGTLGVYGPRAAALLGRVLGEELAPLPEDGFRELDLAGARVLLVGTGYSGGEPGFDLTMEAATVPRLWAALLEAGAELGAAAVGFQALETLRIEAGRPRYGAELTEETIPTEAFESTGLLPRAISFTKGCYTGQEVIVRIAHRGHVNRHLRGLLLGELPPPEPRTPLFHPETGREVGRLTSAALSPLLRQTIALGYLRRELAPGDRVRLGAVDGPEVRVAGLPFDAGADGAGA
jgi:folate-binding protein YgfZ